MIGSESSDGGSSTTSWHGPEPTTFGRESAIDFSFPSARILPMKPSGGVISRTSETSPPRSSSRSTPSAMHIRRSVPNWLMRSGIDEPRTFRKSSAGPPPFVTRSVISAISRFGSTSAVTSTSSSWRRRWSSQSRRSEKAIGGAESNRGAAVPSHGEVSTPPDQPPRGPLSALRTVALAASLVLLLTVVSLAARSGDHDRAIPGGGVATTTGHHVLFWALLVIGPIVAVLGLGFFFYAQVAQRRDPALIAIRRRARR